MLKEQSEEYSPTREMETAVINCLKATRELRMQLRNTAKEQTNELPVLTRNGADLVSQLRNTALASDQDRLEETADKFHEFVEHVLEVFKFTFITYY